MRGVGVAGIESMEATGKKERVLYEAVVEVVVYELPQLGVNRGGRRRHGRRMDSIVDRVQDGWS